MLASQLSPTGGLAVVPPLTHSQAQAAADKQNSPPDTGPGVINAQGAPGRALLDGSRWHAQEKRDLVVKSQPRARRAHWSSPTSRIRDLWAAAARCPHTVPAEFQTYRLSSRMDPRPKKNPTSPHQLPPDFLASPHTPSQLPALRRCPTGDRCCPRPGTACVRSPESLPLSSAHRMPTSRALGRVGCTPSGSPHRLCGIYPVTPPCPLPTLPPHRSHTRLCPRSSVRPGLAESGPPAGGEGRREEAVGGPPPPAPASSTPTGL